ncbi:MAG: hypothetical protein A2W61_07655 [Deltaproteobacteria bacterium RIFCSPLOWO2_01_44_7]|nr:MAG: hypothetical protein A2712_04315 [Deltaproteobacteria bacterium RIFCSPHIGHO2_01_FULL_43_49]OGQ16408.1 MAG: hypothetical protein A3D22_02280 [Deltaproteobacteria bacterium RIFCSPHIGHO2_02_FULL_44_53]OGQ27765.1 MAG: hypothetical protein A3D98_08705 [Deltaproteobacteria bacterium RIFCSPHIGHO2_12_FULL_44_21]OGQ32926.1 MAG: hypothetical protein A2979_10210 [Deltaproteobacteria bacterium RIFCSPLOWO2_01_FULL_45_74]OGQ38701.1 MAG: hypothetical protein A2W61_07655 [Deltaproteobacteria bacterium 
MTQKMTWEEMKKAFPDEWLLIVDYETDSSGHVVAGVVERHSREKDEVFCSPVVNKDCAFKYTGESTFPGGWRSYAQRYTV